MKTVFLRVLESGDKGEALRNAIRDNGASPGKNRFELNLSELSAVPTTPFAYWVSSHIRKLFYEFPRFENTNPERRATKGLATTDDIQFLRMWWELQSRCIAEAWYSFAKGGRISPFYSDFSTYVLWENDGARLKAFLDHKIGKDGQWSRWINSTNYYGRAGITWALRAHRFSPQALPKNSVFSVRGYAAFSDDGDLGPMLAVFNSSIFDYLFKVALGRFGYPEFVVGVLQWLPWAESVIRSANDHLRHMACRAWSLKRSLDTRNEISHAFVLPVLLQTAGADVATRAAGWSERVHAVDTNLVAIQADIDELCFDLYGIDEADRRSITEGFSDNATELESSGDAEGGEDDAAEDPDENESTADATGLAAELVSWAVGVAFGRFDVRLATGERTMPTEPGPFDPLPTCSPGMLAGTDGLPLARPPAGYPLNFPDTGVLVDDPGHAGDLTAAVRAVFEVVFGAAADRWWNDVAALLDPKNHDLCVWLAGSFFEHHLKRYSKSRRKAPIFWQLGTLSSRYSVWLYAHRLTRDSFFQLQNEVVGPKLAHEERKLTGLIQTAGGSPSASQRKDISAQEAIVEELRAMLDDIKRVAPLWYPNLDDGVVLTMASLWRLVPQYKPWQKELKTKWYELSAGKYDWSHIAMHLWPERVVPKCTTDRSLAIAHGLESEFWNESDDGKWKPRTTPLRSVDELVHERSSPAVKAALKSLHDEPVVMAGTRRGKTNRLASAV